MRKVIRDYVRDKNLDLILIGTTLSFIARINALQLLARIKDI